MDLSVIILTLNEERHIRRCIENVRPLAREIFVVDCFSADGTQAEVLKFEGAKVLAGETEQWAGGSPQWAAVWFVQQKWPGTQAAQFNWALDHLPIRTEWVLRLDADEYLTPELVEEIRAQLPTLPAEVTGVVLNLRRVFMGRHLRHGLPKVKLLRLFRFGKGRCEQRLMDEHIELLDGQSVAFAGEFVDHNLHDIGWWTAKHNGYALREAVDLLDMEYGLLEEAPNGERQPRGVLSPQAAAKRRKKRRYARMPLFFRAFVYFLARYVARGGFLEGREGFLWHFLQGWWYRTLVDVKVLEIKRETGGDREKMLALLRGRYGMRI